LQNDDIYDGYYTYRTSDRWNTPVKLFNDIARGYVFRIDIDSQNRVHIGHGSREENVWGPVSYYRLENGEVTKQYGGITRYRADDRLEIDSGTNNNVHLILGCPDSNGGPVTYWRSTNGGDSWSNIGDIHHSEAGGRNGSPDLFVDKNNVVHICYGSSQDASRGGTPSARYARIENGVKVRDKAITNQGELTTWHHGGGIASVAASDDGEYVVIAYQQTDGGALFTRISEDGGVSWSSSEQLASTCGGSEGRDKQFVRAQKNTFYLVYPSSGNVYLRILEFSPTIEQVTAPDRPNGPSSCYVGQSSTFTTGGAESNFGHEVEYQFDWGDGNSSIWGESERNYTYGFLGIYNIKARARCKTHIDVVSSWSELLVVAVLDTIYYTLNVDLIPENAGIVQVNPNKDIYSQNEIVQLIAVTNNGNGYKEGNVHIEAETGLLYGPLVVGIDENASHEKFISCPGGDPNPTGDPTKGRAEYSFSLNESGDYVIWGRIYAPSGEEDSFFFVVDAVADTLLWDLESPYNEWRWMKFTDRESGEFRQYLNTGQHSLTVIKREINSRLDKIIITKDVNFQPQGTEELPPGDNIYNFDHWSGDLIGNENPADIIIDGNKTVVAHFSIEGNEVVSTPSTPVGPDTGFVGKSLNFISGNAKSNFGYNVEYQFDWGDGTISDWGDSSMIHVYDRSDIMLVKARARSKGNNAIISEWSSAHKIILIEEPVVTYSLIVFIDPENKGTVNKSPDKAEYAHGDTVVLYPLPIENYFFDHWSGDLTGNDNPDTVIMNGNKNITAHFVEFITYSLTIFIEPANKGLVIKTPAKAEYAPGDTVVLHSFPDENYVFDHWSADLSGSDNPDTVIMLGNKTITAHFAEIQEVVTIPTTPVCPDSGMIGQNLSFTTGGASCSLGHEVEYQFDWGDGTLSDWGANARNHIYSYADTMRVKARARCKVNNNIVSDWSDYHKVCVVTSFNYTLTVLIEPAGCGTVNKTPLKEEYANNETVILSPLPSEAHKFDHWSGDLTGNDNPAFVIMDKNKNITAHFKLISAVENENQEIPKSFALMQNYPNPFNPETTIQYQLPENCEVRLTIFNMQGQVINILINKYQKAGFYSTEWYARDQSGNIVPSGIYLYRIEAKNVIQINKMILLK